MALIYLDGFDLYGEVGAYELVTDSHWTAHSAPSMQAASGTYARRSGSSLMLIAGNSITLGAYWFHCDLGDNYSTIVLGCAYYASIGTTPGAGYPMLIFQKGIAPATDTQLAIHRTSAHALEVRASAGGSLLGSSDEGVISPGSFQFVEFKVVCHDTAGSIEIRVDNVTVLNLTGINTQNAGSGGVQILHFRNYAADSGNGTYLDDMYVLDDSGSSYTDFLGDVAIDGHLFTADGSDGDWDNTSDPADHYTDIDDLGTGYDTEYIEGDTVGKQDSYDITPTEYQTGIIGVEVVGYGFNNTGGTAKIKPYVKINSVDYYGDEVQMVAGTTDKHSYVWPRNPATDAFWLNADLVSAEFGYEVTEIT